MYHFNEGTLELPEEWKDITVNVLTSSMDNTQGMSFTLSRDTLPWGMTLSEFTDREMTTLSKQLKEFKKIRQEDNLLTHFESITCEFTWRSSQGVIHQLMTLVNIPEKVLILTATMEGLLSPHQQQLIMSHLQTLTLRA